MDNNGVVWIITSATIVLTSGATVKVGQVNVYASGMLIDPRTRQVFSPVSYVTVK